MAGRGQPHLAPLGWLGGPRAQPPSQSRLRRKDIQTADAGVEASDLREASAQQVAIFLQETLDLRRLAVAEGHDLVVQSDRLDRLDVDGGAAARDTVHDSRDGGLRLGPDRYDVAIAADRDEGVL